MKAVTVDPRVGLTFREHPDPQVGHGGVLVRIRAAGVNNADLGQVAGVYPAPPRAPADIPGLEFAGEVVALGPSATRFAIGDRVMGLVGGGAQAESIALDERELMPVPAAFGWAEAGGFPEAFITAHDALFTQCALRPGERVLVTGAAGGVGNAAVQMAAAAGAEVVASVRDPARRGQVAALGAQWVADPAEEAASGPYDVVLELVGLDSFEARLRSLNVAGRFVLIGSSTGFEARVDFMQLAARRATLRASGLRTRPLEDKVLATRAVEREVLPLVGRGKIAVPIAATFPMTEAAAAYEAYRARGKFGKIVLVG
ncbi:MAG: zinc-binding dehydrogenase [Phenylobacterium sp.]|uniref:zinc-binding dehydrogenase n=1 Tax=Phenylobacterium sp. TaxID=1871053 RepID=UPI001A41011C|nr:zinc-binding dehydrogenase [Phenylobacterium sp.]MBL8555190.1 zinc-binding dehydrogenase [Phenylobacterium sp.]